MGTIGRLEFLLLLPTLVHLIIAQQYYEHSCPGSASYKSNSMYENNLNQVFASLTTNVSMTGFNKAVAGLKPDEVYGFVQCRGDVDGDSCEDCVSNAAGVIADYCPQKRSAIIWFYECELRYSDQNFFGIIDTNYLLPHYCNSSTSAPQRYTQSVLSLLKILRLLATSSPVMFSMSFVGYTDAIRIHGVAQCTGDLTLSTCNLCLTKAISTVSQCIVYKAASSVLCGSCIIWYGTSPFLPNLTSSTSRGQPSFVRPANRTTLPSGSRTGLSKTVVTALSFSVAFVLLLCIIGTILLKRRRMTANKDLEPPNDEDELQSVNEALLFSLDIVRLATDDFSQANKLGEGGFGPVYKGESYQMVSSLRRKGFPKIPGREHMSLRMKYD